MLRGKRLSRVPAGVREYRKPAVFTLLAAFLCASCSGGDSGSRYDSKLGVSASPRLVDPNGPIPKGGGSYKVGKPYQVSGRWYYPQHEPGYDEVGIASWYGDDFHARKTSNGEIFDMHALTAAHKTLPMPSYAYVTNLENGRTILVRVNDRGPYVGNRIIDLSLGSAKALGFAGHGLKQVRIRYAGEAPIDGNDYRERKFLAGQPWANTANQYVRAPVSPPYNPSAYPAQPVREARQEWTAFGYRSGLGSMR